jgi:hypothetical protein
MNHKVKVVGQDMQEEMVGVLTAISIVSKRLAARISQLDENNDEDQKNKSKSPPGSEVKT